MFTRKLERVGAIALALGSAGFIAVFLYLQATFGYPDVLEHSAGEVLPRLAAGGAALRSVWLIYAALPLTMAIAGIAVMPLLDVSPRMAMFVNAGGALVAALRGAGGLFSVYQRKSGNEFFDRVAGRL